MLEAWGRPRERGNARDCDAVIGDASNNGIAGRNMIPLKVVILCRNRTCPRPAAIPGFDIISSTLARLAGDVGGAENAITDCCDTVVDVGD